MKTFVRLAVSLMATAALCQASLALAEDYYWASGSGQPANLAAQEKVAGQGQTACNSCNQCSEQCYGEGAACCGCDMGCDECPPWGIVGFTGLDSFRGISDSFDGRTGSGNFGVVTGLNAGAPIPGLRDYGFGWQVGMSYGVYDFDGRQPLYAGESTAQTQQQTFVTTGFFRKAQGDQRLSFGIVYDWMYNTNWGGLANDPSLGQWRGQIEYAVSGCNGIGVWGAQRNLGSAQVIDRDALVQDRAVSQVNLFWHHKFCSTGADSWVYFGLPDHGRYSGDKSFADWTIGFNVQVPLSDRLALYANGSYLHPSAAAGFDASVEQGYDVGMGIMWYFGGNARSNRINGKCWEAYMPVANNSTFLVEQSVTDIGP